MKTLVSVIMTSYNHEKFISKAIEGVLSQTVGDYELIIVDDASSDQSQGIIKSFQAKDKRIKTIFHKNNEGIANVLNDGLSIASGKYVALLASDDIWVENKLEKQLKILEKNENAVVWCEGEIINHDGIATAQTFTQINNALTRRKSGDIFDELIKNNYILGSGLILAKKSIKTMRFNARLKYLNDWLFYASLSKEYPYFFIDEKLVKYRVHGNNTNKDTSGYLRDTIKLNKLFISRFNTHLSKEQKSYLLYSIGSLYEKGRHPLIALIYTVEALLTNRSCYDARYSISKYFKEKSPAAYSFVKYLWGKLRNTRNGNGTNSCYTQPFLQHLETKEISKYAQGQRIPLVSIVMPTYNYARFISEAIESVLRQTVPDFELIIIDDGSTDNTHQLIQYYQAKDKRIKSCIHEDNKGITITLNDGINASTGKYISFIDSDDIWALDKLEKQLEILEKNENLIVWTEGEVIDAYGKATGETFTRIHNAVNKQKSGNIFSELLKGNYVLTSSLITLRKNVEDIRFYEKLKYLNDWLFFVDLAKTFEYFFIQTPLVKYRIHGNNTNKDVDGYFRNDIQIIKIFMRRYKNMLSSEMKSKLYFYRCMAYEKKNYGLHAKLSVLQAFIADHSNADARYYFINRFKENHPLLYRMLKRNHGN